METSSPLGGYAESVKLRTRQTVTRNDTILRSKTTPNNAISTENVQWPRVKNIRQIWDNILFRLFENKISQEYNFVLRYIRSTDGERALHVCKTAVITSDISNYATGRLTGRTHG